MSSPHRPSPGPRWRLVPLAAVLTGGCVVPVAPQWDDAEVNYPPYIVNSTPSVGDIFTPAAMSSSCPPSSSSCDMREINATLSDQNLTDDLFIRWLVDYPSTDVNASKLVKEVEIPPTGDPIRQIVRIQPSCQFLQLSPGDHRWVMSVSDRKFLDALSGEDVSPEAPLDSVPEKGNRVRAIWWLHCP